MTNIATKNGSVIVKDGKAAENCGCCVDGWYCYCHTPSNLFITITNYQSGFYSFSSTLVDGQYELVSNSCLGTWLHTTQRLPLCDATSGAINGIAIALADFYPNGLWVKAGASTGNGRCDGWSTDTFLSAISTASGESAYASACKGIFPITGTALGQSGGVNYFSFAWSIAES